MRRVLARRCLTAAIWRSTRRQVFRAKYFGECCIGMVLAEWCHRTLERTRRFLRPPAWVDRLVRWRGLSTQGVRPATLSPESGLKLGSLPAWRAIRAVLQWSERSERTGNRLLCVVSGPHVECLSRSLDQTLFPKRDYDVDLTVLALLCSSDSGTPESLPIRQELLIGTNSLQDPERIFAVCTETQ